MNLIRIYQCLSDRTRLRILHLLAQGPLCVCHFQTVLREPQAKISKHLAYLRRNGMVECTREGHWMIYRLPTRRSATLDANLACLTDCVRGESAFQADRTRLEKLLGSLNEGCCPACVREADDAVAR